MPKTSFVATSPVCKPNYIHRTCVRISLYTYTSRAPAHYKPESIPPPPILPAPVSRALDEGGVGRPEPVERGAEPQASKQAQPRACRLPPLPVRLNSRSRVDERRARPRVQPSSLRDAFGAPSAGHFVPAIDEAPPVTPRANAREQPPHAKQVTIATHESIRGCRFEKIHEILVARIDSGVRRRVKGLCHNHCLIPDQLGVCNGLLSHDIPAEFTPRQHSGKFSK